MLLKTVASKPSNLAQMTAEEFRARFSTGEGFSEGDIPVRTSRPLYYAPNETQVTESFKELSHFVDEAIAGEANPMIAFYGIIGGVDLTLSYIASIWNELGRLPESNEEGFLTDINEAAIDYLNQRLDIFARSDDLTEYFKILGREIPEAAKALRNYRERLKDEDRAHLWFSQESGFKTLKEMVERERIKPFQSNYYGRGQGIFADLMEMQRPDAAVVYLSDIANVASNRKRNDGLGGVRRNGTVMGKLTELDIPFLIVETDINGRNYISLAGYKANPQP